MSTKTIQRMREKYFTYKTLDDIRKDVERLHLDITFEEELNAIGRQVKIGNRVAGNSLAIHPMEGCDGTLEGTPDELTFRRWHRFAGGGAKLIWGEATAVVPEGRANPRQLLLNENNLSAFERLLLSARKVHRDVYGSDGDLLIGLQLTHSGRYSYRKPMIAYHNPDVDCITVVDKKKGTVITDDYSIISDEYIERLEDSYVEAARRAVEIGFDFIDLKQCHTYLLNELLGARNRPGTYGGSFENRTRFIRNVIVKVKDLLGDSIILASRVNVYDGIPFHQDSISSIGAPNSVSLPYDYAFGIDRSAPHQADLSEPLQLIAMMKNLGVQLINVTIGSPYYNMHIGRPFERVPVDGYVQPEHPLIGVERHFQLTASVQKTFPDLAVVGTGYSWLQKYFINAGESNLRRNLVTIIGVGREAFAYPDFARDALRMKELKSSRVCIAASFCTDLMRAKNNELGQLPTGCVPRDTVYSEIYKEMKKKVEGRISGNSFLQKK